MDDLGAILKKREETRNRFLRRLLEVSKASSRNAVACFQLGEGLGFSDKDTNDVVGDLVDSGFVARITFGNITITPSGIEEAARQLEEEQALAGAAKSSAAVDPQTELERFRTMLQAKTADQIELELERHVYGRPTISAKAITARQVLAEKRREEERGRADEADKRRETGEVARLTKRIESLEQELRDKKTTLRYALVGLILTGTSLMFAGIGLVLTNLAQINSFMTWAMKAVWK